MNRRQYDRVIKELANGEMYMTKRYIYVKAGTKGPVYRLSREYTDISQISLTYMMEHGSQVKEVKG